MYLLALEKYKNIKLYKGLRIVIPPVKKLRGGGMLESSYLSFGLSICLSIDIILSMQCYDSSKFI